jgi:hypothetical protein
MIQLKQQFKYFPLLFYFIVILSSCVKENISKQFDPFYKLEVNGNLKRIEACGTSAYVAAYLGDTAVFVGFGCGGQRAGFYLKGQIIDGTYQISNKNSAWFDEGGTSYQTDSINKGTLTIKSGNFKARGGGIIPFVEGEFSFEAIDKNTLEKIKVTSGKYLLQKYQY